MEDLIRRSDAIKGAKRLHNLFSSPFYNRDRVEMIEEYFNAIPSAESTGDLDNAIYEYVQDGLMSNPYDRPKGVYDSIALINKETEREDLSDEIREYLFCDLRKKLWGLDSRPQGKWIPCSKRLPKEKDAGILKKLGTEKRSEYVLATVEVKGERMTVTACTYDGVWQWDKKYAFPDFKVVAWMPLPKPYKGEDDE